MIDVKKYCEYIYSSFFIPIYIYENKELTLCYPIQKKYTLPPKTYLIKLLEMRNNLSYTITKFYSYYGCIKIKDSNTCIVIGPISALPYSKETLFSMRKEFFIDESSWESFCNFFYNIPTQNLDIFINTLILINYTLNNEELSHKDLNNNLDSQLHNIINQNYSKHTSESMEENILNNNYSIENEFFRYIENGDIEGLSNFRIQTQNMKVGKIADNNLRQSKNIFIVVVTLATRAAIKGGLSPNIAYNLSDTYIQQMERLADINAINSLLNNVLYDYTNRTAKSIIPLNSDTVLHRVIQYVRENTNKNITVADIAEYFGFNRSYLSHKVKKQLGFDLSNFIRQCKLENAKDLLAYSNKSISEISNFLCFSSQSHFQRAFKNQFGITPQTYRKSV
jgi:AraC-like DNA-binding protein